MSLHFKFNKEMQEAYPKMVSFMNKKKIKDEWRLLRGTYGHDIERLCIILNFGRYANQIHDKLLSYQDDWILYHHYTSNREFFGRWVLMQI